MPIRVLRRHSLAPRPESGAPVIVTDTEKRAIARAKDVAQDTTHADILGWLRRLFVPRNARKASLHVERDARRMERRAAKRRRTKAWRAEQAGLTGERAA